VRRVLHGSENSVSAPLEQTLNGTLWRFQRWSDALPQTHQLAPAIAPTRYVATYAPAGGLTGQYFDDLGFAGPLLTRLDPVIDFDWAAESPDPAMGADTFSVRWTGEVKIDFDETYTFSTQSDDGVRLLIDGSPVIDHFDAHSPAVDQGSLPLTAGWHQVLLEYFEEGGGAQLSLSWSSPSQAEQVVPESHLRPGCDASGACSGGLSCNDASVCAPSCDPATCRGVYRCRLGSGGGCVRLCVGVACPAGEKCNGGVCIPPPPPTGTGGTGSGGYGGNSTGGTGGSGGAAGVGGMGGAAGTGGSGGAGSGGGNANAGENTGGLADSGGDAGGNGGTTGAGGSASVVGGGVGGNAEAQGGRATQGGEAGGALEANAGAATDPDGGASPEASGGTDAGAGTGASPSLAEAGGGGEAGNGGETGGSGTHDDSHCSCRAPGSARGQRTWWSLAGLALLLGRRRRRS
jgi:MYXO-CTERM domain-containing protein